MSPFNNNFENERKIVKVMIRIYCKNLQYSNKQFYDNCLKPFVYTNRTLEYCLYGENKPSCKKCSFYFYKQEMREKVRSVMQFSSPIMIYLSNYGISKFF